jgi:uncharacterized protein
MKHSWKGIVLGSLAPVALVSAIVLSPGIQAVPDTTDTGTPELVKDTPIAVSGDAQDTDVVEGFRFEIKDTPEGRQQGLGGRESVPTGYGMLFVFNESRRYGFWMKGMLVPIDILWLSDNGTVIGIESDVSPDSYPTVFYPPQPVRFVLETRAGEASVRGWKVGSQLPLPLRFE